MDDGDRGPCGWQGDRALKMEGQGSLQKVRTGMPEDRGEHGALRWGDRGPYRCGSRGLCRSGTGTLGDKEGTRGTGFPAKEGDVVLEDSGTEVPAER